VTDQPADQEGDGENEDGRGEETPADDHESQPAERSGAASYPFAGMSRVDPTLWRSLRATEEVQAKLGSSVARYFATSGVFSAIEKARAGWLASTQIPALRTAEAIAQLSTGPSLVSGTLAAQLAGARLTELTSLTLPTFKALHEGAFAQLSLTSRFVEQQSAILAAMRPQLEVARSISFATRAWEHVIDMSRPNLEVSLAHVQMTGRGTASAVEAGILLTEPDEIVVEQFRAEASVAIGPSVANEELRTRLASLHPDLPNRLEGAWERIHGGGSDAAGQAATSLMEVIDWTLRMLAPDKDVLAWHAAENRPDVELHNGDPTRPLRLCYAVRSNPDKLRALKLYLKTFQELVSVIQSPKHAIETRAVEALAPVAITVEGLLYYLVVE
jgi:hypothetical protein